MGVERLRGGSKKGVFRLRLTGGESVVLYVWHVSENWWTRVSEAEPGKVDLFVDASGLALFVKAHEQLTALDVPVPDLLRFDGSRTHIPADVALVQDVPAGSLEDLLISDPIAAAPVLERLRLALGRMQRASRATCGKIGAPVGTVSADFPALVLDRALRHLASVASREPRIAAAADRLRDGLRERAEAVRPRRGYSLVHGELGPDHVRVDRHGQPVLIDIEGLMGADAEWEHAFLELRSDHHYAALRVPGLDATRAAGIDAELGGEELRHRFLKVEQHPATAVPAGAVHLAGGRPATLLETGFPAADAMRDITERNLARALAAVAPPRT